MWVTPWFQFRRITGRWVALHLRQPDNDHITAFTIWSRFWLQLRPTIYALAVDPSQLRNVIETYGDIAGELHQFLVRFMRETQVSDRLLTPRLELRI